MVDFYYTATESDAAPRSYALTDIKIKKNASGEFELGAVLKAGTVQNGNEFTLEAFDAHLALPPETGMNPREKNYLLGSVIKALSEHLDTVLPNERTAEAQAFLDHHANNQNINFSVFINNEKVKIMDTLQAEGGVLHDLPASTTVPAADPAPAAPDPTAPEPVKAPEEPTWDRTRDERVALAQELLIAAKAGGYGVLKDVELSNVDGLAGPKTHVGALALVPEGGTAPALEDREAITKTINDKMSDNGFKTAVVGGLLDKIDSDPTFVSDFLDRRGLNIDVNDIEALRAGVLDFQNGNENAINALNAQREEEQKQQRLADEEAQRQEERRAEQAPIERESQPAKLTTKFDTAADPAPGPNYSGIVWKTERETVKVDSDGYPRVQVPGDTSPEEQKRIGLSVRFNQSGTRATFTLEEQTNGINLDGVTKEDKLWERSMQGDPAAASRGIITLGSGGQLYLTRVDSELGLMRANITKYVRENGVEGIGLQHVPFNMEGRSAAHIANGLNTLSKIDGFSKQTGVIIEAEGNIFGINNDAHYRLHAYQDEKGKTQMRLVSKHDDVSLAEAQTPKEIANLGNDFSYMSDIEDVAASGVKHTMPGTHC